MMTARKQGAAIFVDRSTEEWIVRDPAGDYWLVPSCEGGWEIRRPFAPSEETELQPVPGHYIHMLELPF